MIRVDSYANRHLALILLVFSVILFSGTGFAAQKVYVNGVVPSKKQLHAIGIKLTPEKRYWYDARSGLIGLEGRGYWRWAKPKLHLGKLRSNISRGDTGIFFNGRELPRYELDQVEREIRKKLGRGRYWLTADGSGGLVAGKRLFRLQKKPAVVITKSYSKAPSRTNLPSLTEKKPRYYTSNKPQVATKIEKKKANGSGPSGTLPPPVKASLPPPVRPESEENGGSEHAKKSITIEGIPQLPIPIPKWTSRYLLPDKVIFSGDDTETLGDVFDRIEDAMRRAEMYSWSAYAILDDGFAMVTQLEAIDDTGTPRASPNRWAFKPESAESFSIADYFRSLFESKPGRYRVIVLAITHRNLETETDEATSAQLQQLLRDGATALPAELRNKLLLKQTRCIGYVYEFERADSSVTQIDTSNLQVIDHLSAGGYWERQNLQ